MELKTIKEFAHKGNLGEGLIYSNGVFKTNLDGKFNTINNKITEINNTLNKVYKVKGSTTVAGVNSMTVGNAMIGYVYNLTDSGVITNGIRGELNVVKGDNVVYTENGWDEFAASLDLNQCAGQNISIENNVISALGYTYNKEKESFSVGGGTATGQYAYAEGKETTASGTASHTEGSETVALGSYSHAEGIGTTAENFAAHVEGSGTVAQAISHAEGEYTKALGNYSHAEGRYTITYNNSEHAQGHYNVSNKNSNTFGDTLNTQHSIGIGTSEEARKNAQEVMQNGDHYIIGIGDYDGTNIAEAQTLQEVVNSKVNKEEGKGLSTEDYTTEEKTKLTGIEEGAQVNIQPNWNQSDETLKDYIKNKPDLSVYQLKEKGKTLTTNDYTNEDKEKVSLIESLQTTILELQEKINSKEYSIDFESDTTTAQEINLMDSMTLKKLVGYNITGVNLQIGTGSAVNLVLTDNVWEGDPIVINQGERIYWDIVKYDESAPAVLGIYETKIL